MRSARPVLFLTALFAMAPVLLTPTDAFGQFLVDCSGNTPGAYTTINSVVPLLSNGAFVQILGPCAENVTISNLNNLSVGSPWGQPRAATLTGNLTFSGVENLFLYGMNVTDSSSDGIDIGNSINVTLDNCTSTNNAGSGLNNSNSIVTIQDNGVFNDNGSYGVNAAGAGNLTFDGYAGPISVNSNVGGGIQLQDGVMNSVSGNLLVEDNTANPAASLNLVGNASGYGITFQGHARAVLYDWQLINPNVIKGNQAGGIAIHEGSEISLSGPPPNSSGAWLSNIIEGNGPVGIYVGLGSQLTLYDGFQITNHSDAAVDVYGHSEVFIAGSGQITGNGTGPASTYPARAGVRIDGNSEAYVRGGQISQNGGPGVLALTDSSVDLSGATLNANSGGSVVCDSSSWLVTNQATISAAFGPVPTCREPNTLGSSVRPFPLPQPQAPNSARMKAQEARYQQLMSSF